MLNPFHTFYEVPRETSSQFLAWNFRYFTLAKGASPFAGKKAEKVQNGRKQGENDLNSLT